MVYQMALHRTAIDGYMEVVDHLIKSGADNKICL